MIVTRIHVPQEIRCGDPPMRLIDALDVYEDGTIVGHPGEEERDYIVFESIIVAMKALKTTMETALLHWIIEQGVETNIDVCRSCLSVVRGTIDGHRPYCIVRKKAEEALKVIEKRQHVEQWAAALVSESVSVQSHEIVQEVSDLSSDPPVENHVVGDVYLDETEEKADPIKEEVYLI